MAKAITFDADGEARVSVQTQARDWPSFRVFVANDNDDGWHYWYSNRVRLSRPTGKILLQVEGMAKAYQPGQQVDFSISTKDGHGKPVSATLCVAVVDERIYDATRMRSAEAEDALDPHTTGPSATSAISSETSDPWLLLGSMMNRGTTNSARGLSFRSGWPGASSGAAPGTPTGSPGNVSTTLRKDFRPTAYFLPAVSTDNEGRAAVSFTLPDQLTTWRCTIVAVDGTGRARTERAWFHTRKQGAAGLILPRFFRTGDRLLVPVLHAPDVEVESSVAGALLLHAESKAQDPKQAVQRQIPVMPTLALQAKGTGSAMVNLRARLEGKVSDRAQFSIQVLPDTLPRFENQSFFIEKRTVLQRAKPKGATQRLIIYGSRETLLRSAATYLGGYPHGCVEQICSRLLPLFLGKEIDRLWVGTGKALSALERQRRIQEGFAKLRQRLVGPSRGFRWWMEADVDPRMSALALTTLSIAKQSGIDPAYYDLTLDPGKGRLLEYAEALIAQKGLMHLAVQGPDGGKGEDKEAQETPSLKVGPEEAELIVACLRYRPDLKVHPEAVRALLAARQDLPAGLLARAGLALYAAGDREVASQVLDRLLAGKDLGGANPFASPYPGESEVCQVAQCLELLLRVDRRHAERLRLVPRLLGLSRDGRFGETYATACALQALLMDMEARVQTKGNQSQQIEIRVDGKAKQYDLLAHKNGPLIVDIRGKHLEVLPAGGESLHLVLETRRDEKASDHAGWQKPIQVNRTLRRPGSTFTKWRSESLDTEHLGGLEVVRGQTTTQDQLEVEIRIRAGTDLRYLSLICPIPAGWEVVGGLDFGTIHDDEAIAAIPLLEAGVERSYFLRLCSAMVGEVSWPPARAFSMYQPAISGASKGERIEVRSPRKQLAASKFSPLFHKLATEARSSADDQEEADEEPEEKQGNCMALYWDLVEKSDAPCWKGYIRNELSAIPSDVVIRCFKKMEAGINTALGNKLDGDGIEDLAYLIERSADLLIDVPDVHGALPGASFRYLQAGFTGIRVRVIPILLESAETWSDQSEDILDALYEWPEDPLARKGILTLARAAVATGDPGVLASALNVLEDLELWPELADFWVACGSHPRAALRAQAFRDFPEVLWKRLPLASLRELTSDYIGGYQIQQLARCGENGKQILIDALRLSRLDDTDEVAGRMGKEFLLELTLQDMLALEDESSVLDALAHERFSIDMLMKELRKPSSIERRALICRAVMLRGVKKLDLDEKDAFASWFRDALSAFQGDKPAAKRILALAEREEGYPWELGSLFAACVLDHISAKDYLSWDEELDPDNKRRCLARFSIPELKSLVLEPDFDDRELIPPAQQHELAKELMEPLVSWTGRVPANLALFAGSTRLKSWLQDYILGLKEPDESKDLAQEFYEETGFALDYRDAKGTRASLADRNLWSRERAFYRRGQHRCPANVTEIPAPVLRQRVGLER